MENQSDVLTTQIFNTEAFEQLKDALTRVANAIASAVKKMLQQTTRWIDALLRAIATPKEWHIYKHTKKRRIHEKYRKRLTRRLLLILSEARSNDNE